MQRYGILSRNRNYELNGDVRNQKTIKDKELFQKAEQQTQQNKGKAQ